MIETLALTALSGGLSMMSGMGAASSTAKQGRLQMMENARVDSINYLRNLDALQERRALGRELMGIEERESVTETTVQSGGGYEGYVNVDALMAGAERAGFNPVTWLQAGALSAYSGRINQDLTTTRTVNSVRSGHNAAAAFQMMMPDPQYLSAGQVPRVPSMMETVGNAGQAALGTYMNLSKQSNQADLQRELLGMKLSAAGVQGGGGLTLSGGMRGVPLLQSVSGTRVSPGGGGAAAASGLSAYPNYGVLPAGWEVEKPKVTPAINGLPTNLGMADSQNVEDRYAELVSMPYGALLLANDGMRWAGTTRMFQPGYGSAVWNQVMPTPGMYTGAPVQGGLLNPWNPQPNYNVWNYKGGGSASP